MSRAYTTAWRFLLSLPGLCLLAVLGGTAGAGEKTALRVYHNRLTPLKNLKPLLADHPKFVAPLRTGPRYEAPILIDDEGADLQVRAWRFSYNARGVIEVSNRLRGRHTAVLVVHPWGVDDGQGWQSPEPAGVAFACTPAKNRLALGTQGTVYASRSMQRSCGEIPC